MSGYPRATRYRDASWVLCQRVTTSLSGTCEASVAGLGVKRSALSAQDNVTIDGLVAQVEKMTMLCGVRSANARRGF
jgi:hypothetical protein